jgi:hypothetical protein
MVLEIPETREPVFIKREIMSEPADVCLQDNCRDLSLATVL